MRQKARTGRRGDLRPVFCVGDLGGEGIDKGEDQESLLLRVFHRSLCSVLRNWMCAVLLRVG